MQVSSACLYCFRCPALYLFLRRWPFHHPAQNLRRLAVNQNRYRFVMLPWPECAISFEPDGRTNSIKNSTPDKPRPIQPLYLQPWMVWSYRSIIFLSWLFLGETSKQIPRQACVSKSLLLRSWRSLEGRVSTKHDEPRDVRNLWIDLGHGTRHTMIYWLMSFSAAAQEQKLGVKMLVLQCPCDAIPVCADCRVSWLPLSK